ARACRSGAGRRHQFRRFFGGLCGGRAPESGGIADAGAPRTGPSWRTVRGWDRPGNGVAAEPRRSPEPFRTPVRPDNGAEAFLLALFTTLPATGASREDLLQLYGKRWNIELDLRTLKGTLQLEH